LRHDQFDILILKTLGIDLFSIVFVIVFLVITSVDGLTLTMVVVVVMAGVIVSSVVVGLGSDLLGSGSLSLRVKVLNLGLTENAVRNVRLCSGS
jgi:hypothetical protein